MTQVLAMWSPWIEYSLFKKSLFRELNTEYRKKSQLISETGKEGTQCSVYLESVSKDQGPYVFGFCLNLSMRQMHNAYFIHNCIQNIKTDFPDMYVMGMTRGWSKLP